MAHGQIETASARPADERPGTLDQVPGFGRQLAAAVAAYDFCDKPGSFGQLYSLCKRASRHCDFVAALRKLGAERAKERHVRRVCKVNPDAHRRRGVMSPGQKAC